MPYIKLINAYNASINSSREVALVAVNKLEQLCLQQNNLFFLSDAYFKKALIYYFNSDYTKAKAYAGKAIENAKRSNNYKILLKATNILGAIYYNFGDLKKAEYYYLEKIETAHLINDSIEEIGTYYNLGLIYVQQGNYLKSANINFKALDFFERSKDTFNLHLSLHAIGYAYMNLEDIPSALKFYRRSLGYALHYKDKYDIAGIYTDISSAYDMLKNIDSAIYYIDLSLKMALKEKDDFHFIIALNAKAGYYLKQENYFQALSLSKEAEILILKSDRKLALCEVYSNTSTAYLGLNQLDNATIYAYKGYKLGAELHQPKYLYVYARVLSSIYEEKHMVDSAFKYFKLYFAFNDSLKKESQLRGIAQKEFIYEKKNQEQLRAKEQQLSQTKLEKQKQINLIVIVASILLAIFLIIGIINFKQKQKANALVVKQKLLLEDKQKEIIDSINYASRIQRSLMPTEIYISKYIKK